MICLGASPHQFGLLVPKDQAVEALKNLHKHFIEKELLVHDSLGKNRQSADLAADKNQ